MKVPELKQRLEAAGCSPLNYSIAPHGDVKRWEPSGPNDSFCLAEREGIWQVYYSERGHDSPPIFREQNEEKACSFFFDYITAMRHDHCVGFFQSESKAKNLQAEIIALEVDARRDNILWATNEKRYRVFVTGRAIFKVRGKYGAMLPIKD